MTTNRRRPRKGATKYTYNPVKAKALRAEMTAALQKAEGDRLDPNFAAAQRAYAAEITPLIDWLHRVNGRAQRWTLRADGIIAEMDRHKNAKRRSTLTIRSGGPSAKAYRYPVVGTFVRCTKVRDGWRVDCVDRTKIWPRTSYEATVRSPTRSVALPTPQPRLPARRSAHHTVPPL